MFSKFAKWYDLHYRSLKDYEEESGRIHYLLSQFESKPVRILDIGCGTGEHARILSTQYGYHVDGIDIEPELVALASKKNPDRDFSCADMSSFSIPQKYDAILCLYSSIAYVETVEKLQGAIDNMATHLNPGGIVLIEAWVEPSEWVTELVDAFESFDETSQTRVLQSRHGSTEGNVSILQIDYHVETPDEKFDFTETHRLALFTKGQIQDALRNARFEPRYSPKGVLEQALHMAIYTP